MMISEFLKFLNEHSYVSAVLALLAGWLIRHRGIGAGYLPWLSGQPTVPATGEPKLVTGIKEVLTGPPAALATRPKLADRDEQALALMRIGAEAGVTSDVMPAVQKLLTPKS